MVDAERRQPSVNPGRRPHRFLHVVGGKGVASGVRGFNDDGGAPVAVQFNLPRIPRANAGRQQRDDATIPVTSSVRRQRAAPSSSPMAWRPRPQTVG
jgi:hypothetical protein